MTPSMPPPGQAAPPEELDPQMGDTPQDDEAGKAPEAEAIVLRGNEKTCESCMNYDSAQGTCAKVSGMFDPDDRCLRFYEDSGEKHDEGPESSENPADDQGGEMPPPGGGYQ